MANPLITRDDVEVDRPRRHNLSNMLTLEVTRISVAGAEYEIGIIGGRFREPSRTVVLSGWTTVVEQESADPEQAITALLEVLNEQAR